MKNSIKILSILFLMFVAVSCSKDDNPADNNVFVGTYNGSVGYIDGDESIDTNDGAVTVVKTGNSYYFRFSNSIPDLTGVSFQEQENTLVNVDFEDGVQYIKVTASSLTMLYMKDGKTWSANATR